jgi:sugar (pentulose or hexulose) kinase
MARLLGNWSELLSTDVALGLDIGTTSCKVLALDVSGQTSGQTSGQMIAVASSPTPLRRTESAGGEYVDEFDPAEL